ncbi:DNA damage response protein RcaA [Aspergillus phoenicis ATCC 13157]|uniref:DNA damage response protein RcaA n=1 Tax=Aspergillus phoenicis ATCC 13157 TaxID=1353007 RepID=A0A370PJT3_ASPPH|nr:DNA damage response protein RcaA [Aspergillus phoenicis ATCC 13157]
MWILDSEGDFLGGKRVWLRPGKKYLFGRIKQDGVRHAIDNKSISRKHMMIEVSPVKSGDGSHIYTRSKIAVRDLGSKYGTKVDGNTVKDESKGLTGEEHEIKLGRYEHALRIKWQPVVLTFSFSSKELKAKDPLAQVRSRVEDLDIKTIIPYVVDHTTHVVQKKRNTAKGLQALVNGKYIVQDSYLDALVYAATPSDLENLESLSPLEADFDTAWPDAMAHLPPPGKETVQRTKEAFAPKPDRINVFEDYTFVFMEPAQFGNLQDVITNGHGKALLYQVEEGVTTAAEIVQYMRNAAGDKGLGSQRDGPGGVVLVRYVASGRHENWWAELGNEVALTTDQRVIQQSEFLDAILGNDASGLCRSLPEAQDMDTEPTPAPAATPDVQEVQDSQPPTESQPSTKRKPRVRGFVSKMKTFDDGFDINSIPVHAPESFDESPPLMDIEPSPAQPSQPQSSLQVEKEEEEEDMVSSLLPGAQAMKRRRAQTTQRAKEEPSSETKDEAMPRVKRQKLDVLEAARQHREAEDAQRQRRAEEASLQGSLEDVNVEQLKGLAIVEEMEVKPRNEGEEDRRWEDRWNGRKNFKKFRRKGEPGQPRYRIQTVIVPLEEVTRKEFGIGDHYWVSNRTEQSPADRPAERAVSQDAAASRSQSSGRVESETPAPRETRSQPRVQKRMREEQDSDSDDGLRFRFRRRR